MLSDKIKNRLIERFAAPLSEFNNRRIIFWQDEDGEFKDAIDELEITKVNIIKLTGTNNFQVKKLLSFDDLQTNYLVYDSLTYERDQKDDWLLDIKLYSEEFRADLVSIQMEELSVESSSAMRKTVRLYSKFLENKDRKAKLQRLGKTYQTPISLHIDVMAVLCGLNGGTAQDIIIAILKAGLDKQRNELLSNIDKFGNIEAFWQLVQKYTGYVDSIDRPLSELLHHIIITGLSLSLPDSVLRGLDRYISDTCKTYCYQLVHEWQRRDDEELLDLCRLTEHELRLNERFERTEISTLLKSDLLPAIDESIIKRIFIDINDNVIKNDLILEVVENRRTSWWYKLNKDYIECLYFVAKMQDFYIAHNHSFHLVEPHKIWDYYTTEGYYMDSYYRKFHYHFSNTLKSPNNTLEDLLKKSSDVVEGLYCEWYLRDLTTNWTSAIEKDLEKLGYISEINKQRDFFRRYVTPNLDKNNKVFVIISDALRFEVAAELSDVLNHSTKGKSTIEAMQAIFPSITKVGMAALLPGRNISFGNQMDVLVDELPTMSTIQRNAILQKNTSNSVAIVYKDLLQMKQADRRSLVQGKEVIYIYHNTIDAIGDKLSTETKVFEACHTTVTELSSIVKVIVNDLSGSNIYITADHGFLYTYKPLEESQKINRQTFSGEILELGRRYALVSPNTTAEYLLPVKVDHEIEGQSVMAYTPKDIIRIKVQGGGENYVHGGVSLQEMAVPVIIYKGIRSGSRHYVEVQNPGLSLISESRKISNLIFSLDFLQKQPIGEKIQASSYSLVFTDELGIPVSDTQTIIADKVSDNASDRVFRIKFTLKPMQFSKNKIYRLVISNGTEIPEEIEFMIDIVFADDFGFDL